MMVTFGSQIIVVLFLFSSTTTSHISLTNNAHKVVRCNEKDRRILLMFKEGVIDDFDRLSTWSTEEDCCAWNGVECNNITHRVTKLDLQPRNSGFKNNQFTLKGEINLSLLELEFLTYLDLSFNRFEVISIPPIIHNTTFASNLHHLDLSSNVGLRLNNLHWLTQLVPSLKYLDLSEIDLHKQTSWLQLVAKLPSLSHLSLADCNLSNISLSLSYVNFSSLVTLDLSFNNFNSKLPYWLSNLPNLADLDLSYNQFKGSIPNWIGQYEHLIFLDLSNNMFYGSIPSTLGNLSSLVSLSIGSNSLSGGISQTIFSNLPYLEDLDLSDLTFAFHFHPDFIPPFQLGRLDLSNTNQGPYFPSWIYTQKLLYYLDMSNTRISFIDEYKFRNLIAGIDDLHLSYNSISGDISNVTLNATEIYLDHNNFTASLPHISPNASHVDLSYNSFSGPIPCSWKNFKDLEFINLWSNQLSGEVPMDLSNWTQVLVLNLGKNKLSGTIPIKMPPNLQVMIMRSNQFEGNIPPEIFNLSFLCHLDLAHNKLSGSIPHSANNITQMITDKISEWPPSIIDLFTKGQYYELEMDPERRTIDISVNNLSGEIPLQLFGLIQLQTLNLSHNHFNGTIDKRIGNMRNLESLDFSNNNLSGEIPQSMAALSFLEYLNLSCNNFIGQIPTGTQLQSFDASSYIGNSKLWRSTHKVCHK